MNKGKTARSGQFGGRHQHQTKYDVEAWHCSPICLPASLSSDVAAVALDRNSSAEPHSQARPPAVFAGWMLSGATGRSQSLPERLVGLIASLLARFADIVKHVIVEIKKRATLALAIQQETQVRDALAEPPGAR